MFTIQTVTSPRWMDAAQTLIECQVKFVEASSPQPFGASAADPILYVREVFSRCAAGEFGPVAPYVAPPAPTNSMLARKAIVALEAQQAQCLTSRALREFYLAVFTLLNQTSDPVFTTLKSIDDAIKVKRADV